MALTLVSLALLATTAMAAPMPQPVPADNVPSTSSIRCQFQLISQKDDTCKSIGAGWGFSEAQIFDANPFLDCNNIWVGTPICMPDVPRLSTSTIANPTISTIVSTATSSFGRPSSTTTSSSIRCQFQVTSQKDDTCSSIGIHWGFSGSEIWQANPFLDCENIWIGTPICIPDHPRSFRTSSTIGNPISTTVVRSSTDSTASTASPTITISVGTF
ncbi:hypothetical protein FRC19_011760 [Serendipita sp. 401]|nr:hypothetical protein FRC19_011760 [Serendipita sp. 401]KAG9051820.1 hypothetical protein FS842_010987 [Serendipita sp. 407]